MIGLVVFIIIVILLVSCFVRNVVPDTNIDLKSLGRWAVVTGATDGIGKAFSHELAKKGFKLFLVSRNQEKLESTAKEIEEKYGADTKIFPFDFSEPDKKSYAVLKGELQNVEVGILINNVGTALPHPEYFLDVEKNHEELYDQLINVNITSAVNMTRFVLPGMLKRRKGLIVNVSSMLSEFPSPLQAMYGASKSFLAKFSRDLDLEYRNKGVHIHVLCTGLVATKLSQATTDDWLPPAVSPADYARSALVQVTKWRVSSGHVSHTLQTMMGRMTNPWFLQKTVLTMMLNRRKLHGKGCSKCSPQLKND